VPLAPLLAEVDARVFRALYDSLSGPWLWPMAALSAVGGGWGSVTLLPMLAWKRTRPTAQSLAIVLATTTTLVFVLKRVFMRVRPCSCLAGVKSLVFDAPTDPSFPSGHAAGSFAFAVFLALVLVRRSPEPARLRWAGAAALVVFAAGVGLSRIALGVHFPGDVLSGALLGTLIGTVGARLHLA
jgi:undecaprenyl-diphosphatase